MAETRKTTKTVKAKTTKSAKTVPAKKPATKPAGKSVKPKATKTVNTRTNATKTTTAKTSNKKPVARKEKNGAKTVLIVIIVVAVAAVLVGVAACIINKCFNSDIIMIENGNGQEIEAKRIGLEGYNYSIAVPTNFKELSQDEIQNTYDSKGTIAAAYDNPDNNVNIAFSKPANNLKNDQVEEYLNAMKLILSTSANVIDTDVYEVDGHNVGTIRVISTSNSEKVYSQMVIFSYNDQIAAINFSCEDEVRGEWEKAGQNIIKTLEIK